MCDILSCVCKYIIKSWLKEGEHAKYPLVWAQSATVCHSNRAESRGGEIRCLVTYMKFLSINVINGSSKISRISAKRSSHCSETFLESKCGTLCGDVWTCAKC